jgi:hypothetical protein
MKALRLWLIVGFFVFVNSLSENKVKLQGHENQDFGVLEAIKGIFKDYFVPRQPHVDLIFCGSKSETLADTLLREKPQEITIRVTKLENVKAALLNSSAIVLFDSGEHFKKYSRKITIGILNPKVFLFVPKRGIQDLVSDIRPTLMNSIKNTNFIIQVNKTTVDLIASFEFTPGKCRQPQYKTINRFSTSRMKWDNGTFFPEKYENFHGCPLKVGVNEPLNAAPQTSGRITQILAEKLNFQIDEKFAHPREKGYDTLDLLDLVQVQSIAVFSKMEFSSSLYTDCITFTVPAGEPYTLLEKMFLMFDKETWICIGIILAGSLLVIQVINRLSVQVQNFVYGQDIQTPTLNVADIFLNGGQHRVPTRNFARFMLMLFFIWSLIVRTCYQSMLYKNLQQDMRNPILMTFAELNERNFTVVIFKNAEVLLGKEFVKR